MGVPGQNDVDTFDPGRELTVYVKAIMAGEHN